MNIRDWLRPGIGIKRWITLCITGVVLISTGLSYVFKQTGPPIKLLLILLMGLGGLVVCMAFRGLLNTYIRAITGSSFKAAISPSKLKSLLLDKKVLDKGPRIVVIGGGTGLSTMLRGLKHYSSNITAIVTTADDGGGSGVLRDDLGMLPPGDIRNCILALADTEPIMEKLLQYRFPEGMLKGQSFGNLFLAAMDGISINFQEAVKRVSEVLAVTGKVLPVSLDDLRLCAELEDGTIICGESKIAKHNTFHKGRIKRVFLNPDGAKSLPDVRNALQEADIIVLGPGSLYTSIIPNLLVEGVCDCIRYSPALRLYVCNIMTQPGETDDYSVLDHIRAIETHSFIGIVDHCIVNTAGIPEHLKLKYREEGAAIVHSDLEVLHKAGINTTHGDFVTIHSGLVRHNADKLAETIVELVDQTVFVKHKQRIIEKHCVKNI